jgi:hypothetical protein
MKKRFNLIGDTFTHRTGGHTGYSVHGKVSKYIDWVCDDSIGDTFYVDDTILNAFHDGIEGRKYAWLLESKYIKPEINNHIRNNYKDYINTFDLIFTHDKDLIILDSKFKWVPAQGFWIKEPKIYEKSKLISMIASNKKLTEGQALRVKWVEMIGDQVDLYGRGFNEIANKEEGLCDYMFSVVIENGFYESYFTEKILDCFATGTIPVYMGSPDIAKYFNSDGIIFLSEEFEISDDMYYNKMSAIQDNLERCKQYEVLEDFIFLNYFKSN